MRFFTPTGPDTIVSPTPLANHDRDKAITRTSQRELRSFLSSYSTLRGLKLCTKYQRCNKPLCPYCTVRRSSDARARLAPLARCADRVLVLRLSLPVSPDLLHLWDDLEDARVKFMNNGFLSDTSWWCQRELTYAAGRWNLHLNFLIFGDDERLQSLLDEAPRRWARLSGVDIHGQDARVWEDTYEAVKYHVKPLLSRKRDSTSITPGDLLELAYHGDADALDAWTQIENLFNGKRRWFTSGGLLRDRQAVKRRDDVALAA